MRCHVPLGPASQNTAQNHMEMNSASNLAALGEKTLREFSLMAHDLQLLRP